MLRTLTKQVYRDLVLGIVLLCFGAALLLYPTQSMEAGRQGLHLCSNVIIPSLFPFFVLSSLVVELGMARYLGRLLQGLMYPLFRVNGTGASALVLGFVGGYPVGARTAINLYEKGLCSKTEAERMLAFCNNSGPAFILGVVGAGVFSNGWIGLMLYLAHVAASVCVGVLFRFYGPREERSGHRRPSPQFQATRFSTAFTSSIKDAFLAVLNICSFVIFFTVLIRMLSLCGVMGFLSQLIASLLAPLGLDRIWAEKLLVGLLEVSSGVTSLTAPGALPGRVSLAAFMLGWAGLSVHCQVLSFVGDSGLTAGTYLTGKVLHGLLSAVFTAVLTRLFPLEEPVSSYLTQQLESLTCLDFSHALSISAVVVWLVWLLFLFLTLWAISRTKKRCGKQRGCAL